MSRLQSSAVRVVLFALLVLTGATQAQVPISVSDAQAKAAGIRTVALTAAGRASIALPALVSIPNDQVHLVSAPLAAVVQSLAVAPGDVVKKGQLLARLAGASVAEVQRESMQAQAQLKLAAQSLARDEQLYREGIIAEARLQSSRAQHAQAAALAAEKRQALRLAGVAAGQSMSGGVDLHATIDGVVLEQNATVGQRVEAAAPLYRIGRLAPLWLEVQVPVAVAADLAPGARVSVAEQATGQVTAIGRQVNPGTQSVAVRATITDGAQRLRPGQQVEAVLELPPPPAGTWRIPRAALVRQQEQALVFVRQPGGFRAQPVKVIGQAGDAVLVQGKLKGGEEIVVAGTASLKGAMMGIGKAE